MTLTTTNSVEGLKIQSYLGIVNGVSVNTRKSSFSFKMEKYYDALEASVNEVKDLAFQNLTENALKLKANAVVGIKVDVETFPGSTLILVSITGTAVIVF